MKRFSVVIGVVLVALFAQPSAAQVSISPYAGLMIYDGSLMIYENSVYRGSGIEDETPVPTIGLRLSYEIAPRWSAELSYGRSWLENGRGPLASHFYSVTAQYAFVRSATWTAHLVAGGGGTSYGPSAADLNSLSDATIAGGVGLSRRLTPRLDLRADLRFIGQFCRQANDRDGLVCNDGSQLGYSELSAGLRFHF